MQRFGGVQLCFQVAGALDHHIVGGFMHFGDREGPDLLIDELDGEELGKEVDGDDFVHGRFCVARGLPVIAADFGFLRGADVFLVAEDDVVVAVPDERDGDGGAADFFVIEGNDGTFGVAADGDFAFDAAGEGGKANSGEEEAGEWELSEMGGEHGADCNVGVEGCQRGAALTRGHGDKVKREWGTGQPSDQDSPCHLVPLHGAFADDGASEVARGEGQLQIVAAGGAGEVEDFADEVERGNDFRLEGVGVDFGEGDAAGGDHRFLEAAGGVDGEAGVFKAFGEAVDLGGGEGGRRVARGGICSSSQNFSARRAGRKSAGAGWWESASILRTSFFPSCCCQLRSVTATSS